VVLDSNGEIKQAWAVQAPRAAADEPSVAAASQYAWRALISFCELGDRMEARRKGENSRRTLPQGSRRGDVAATLAGGR
jgi:hypothetical protein